MTLIQRSFLWLLVASMLCGYPSAVVLSDDDSDKASEETASEVDPFEVPEGTPRELFLFINRIKRIKPKERTREAIIEHLRNQIGAVDDATDRILEMEIRDKDAVRAIEEKYLGLSVLARFDPQAEKQLLALAESYKDDPRPAVVHSAEFQLLQLAIMNAMSSPGGQDSIATDIFAFIDRHGLDRQGVSIAAQFASPRFSRQMPEVSATILARLVPLLEESDNADFRVMAPEIAAVARRLNLPGSFMELSGVTADGSEFDWESYRGRYVLIDFWATWCGPCRAEIPNVKKNLEKYGAEGFAVVGVNLDQDRDEYDAYMEEAELPWQNIMPDEEGNNEMAAWYGISGIPTVILVDREGKVISVNARGPELGRLLEAHLGS